MIITDKIRRIVESHRCLFNGHEYLVPGAPKISGVAAPYFRIIDAVTLTYAGCVSHELLRAVNRTEPTKVERLAA